MWLPLGKFMTCIFFKAIRLTGIQITTQKQANFQFSQEGEGRKWRLVCKCVEKGESLPLHTTFYHNESDIDWWVDYLLWKIPIGEMQSDYPFALYVLDSHSKGNASIEKNLTCGPSNFYLPKVRIKVWCYGQAILAGWRQISAVSNSVFKVTRIIE